MNRWPAIALVIAILGCRSSGPRDDRAEGGPETSPTSSTDPSCVMEIKEKLGVTFVRLCAQASGIGPSPAPFWISTIPLGCSQGAHDTLRCPPVLAVVQPRPADPPALRGTSSQIAAVVESDTAHGICEMRFAGRLPTRQERALARASLGLSTVVVAESNEIGGIRLRELAEWVTEKPCDRTTLLASACGIGGFPWEGSASIPWDLVVVCEAVPMDSALDRPLIEINGACPTARSEPDASITRVPCAVRGPAIDPRGRGTVAMSLTCARPLPPPRVARSNTIVLDVAAFHCVIPEWH